MIVAGADSFYFFGDEPAAGEESYSVAERAHRMANAFVRRCLNVKEWRRACRPSAIDVAALVDVFRMLQAWDDEARR